MKFLHDIELLQASDDLTSEMALVLVNNIVKKRNLGDLYLKGLTMNMPNFFNPVSATATPAASTLTFSLANQTAKSVFAAPIANNGTPTFRALTLADVQDFYTSVDKTQLNYWTLTGSDVYRATGNVYIGHTSSLGAYKLQVTGDGYFTGGLGIGGAIQSGFKLDVNGQSVTRGSSYKSGSIIYFGAGTFNINAASNNDISLNAVSVNVNAFIRGTVNAVLSSGTNYYTGQTINVSSSVAGSGWVNRTTINYNNDAFTSTGHVFNDVRQFINRTESGSEYTTYGSYILNNGTGTPHGKGYSASALGTGNWGTYRAFYAGFSGPPSNTSTFNQFVGFETGNLPANIANFYGVRIANYTGTSTSRALFLEINAATNNWNIYASGTANNYMAGALVIGSLASLSNVNFRINKAISGSASASYGMIVDSNIASDVTNFGIGIQTNVGVASSTTLNLLVHNRAVQGAFNGSTVANQYGYQVDAGLIGATNNFGFRADIPFQTGANRWNFYASGTAWNYFAGNVGIGTTSINNKLEVWGAGNTVVNIQTNSVTDGTYAEIKFATTNAVNSYRGGAIRIVRGSTIDKMVFSVSNSSVFEEKATLYRNGSFVIGNTPDNSLATLQVTGSIYSSNLAGTTTMLKTVAGVITRAVDGTDYYSPATIAFANYWTLASGNVYRATGKVFINSASDLGAYNLQVTGASYFTLPNSNFTLTDDCFLYGANSRTFKILSDDSGNNFQVGDAANPFSEIILYNQLKFSNHTGGLLKTDATGLVDIATGADIATLLGTAASGNYIQNQFAAAQSGSFWINGIGAIGALYSGYKFSIDGSLKSSSSIISDNRSDTNNIGTVLTYPNYNFVGWGGYWGIRTATTEKSFNIDTFNGGSFLTPLTVLQGGNVGINTTNPQYKLDVLGIGRFFENLYVQSSTTSNSARIGLYQTGSNWWYIENVFPGHLKFTRGTTDYAMFANDGKFLVGTNSVYNGSLVQVNGSITQRGVLSKMLYADSTGQLIEATAAHIAATLGAGNYIQNQFAAAQSGSFWISGQARVDGYFHVNSSVPTIQISRGGVAKAYIGVAEAINSFATGTAIDDVIFRTQGGALHFVTNGGGSSAMYINSSQNVGIRNTSPFASLHVAYAQGTEGFTALGPTATGRTVMISNSNGLYGLHIGVNPYGESWIQSGRRDSATAYSLILQHEGGNVGIGLTNTSAKLSINHLNGVFESSNPYLNLLYNTNEVFKVYMDGNWNTVFQTIQNGANQSGFRFVTNGNERVRITKDGKVLINTVSSFTGSVFQVAGSITQRSVFSGMLYADANGQLIAATAANIAATLGAGNYIQNGTALQTANFNISGYGIIGQGAYLVGEYPVLYLNGTQLNAVQIHLRSYVGGVSNGGFEIYDQTNAASRFVILPNGSVGVGTNAPNYKFQVNDGNIATTGVGAGFVIGNREANGHDFQWYSYGTALRLFGHSVGLDLVAFQSDGKVLIGTASPNGTWKVQINSGSTSGNGLYVSGKIYATDMVTSMSDKRQKKSITDLVIGNRLDRINIKRYKFRKATDGRFHIGVLAQDFESIFPELVDEQQGIKSFDYLGLAAVALGLGLETKKRVDTVEQRVKTLEEENKQLKTQITQLLKQTKNHASK